MNMYICIYGPPNTTSPTNIQLPCNFERWRRITEEERDAMIKKIIDEYPNLTGYIILAR